MKVRDHSWPGLMHNRVDHYCRVQFVNLANLFAASGPDAVLPDVRVIVLEEEDIVVVRMERHHGRSFREVVGVIIPRCDPKVMHGDPIVILVVELPGLENKPGHPLVQVGLPKPQPSPDDPYASPGTHPPPPTFEPYWKTNLTAL